MQPDQYDKYDAISFKSLFFPLTTLKAIVFISLIGIMVFCNSLFNGFVWDDLVYIVANPSIRSFDISHIVGENLFNLGGQYRPFVSFYFSIMYMIFKDIAFFYHFLSVIFHIINTVLLLLLFRKFFSIYLAFFLSVIFLVHPIQVESVVFAAVAGDKFFFLFGLTALLLSMKEKISLRRGAGIGCLLLLSILSKETGILFFLMIFIYRTLYQKNNNSTLSIAMISATLVYAVLRFFVAKIYLIPQTLIVPIAQLSIEERLLNIPAILFYYLKTFFFPEKLVIMQYWIVTTVDYEHFYLPIILVSLFLVSILLFGIYLIRRSSKLFKLLLFFLIWIIVGMLLHIQIFPLNMTVADRWFYFPMVGLLGVIGVFFTILNSKYNFKHISVILGIFSIIIIILLSIRTVIRNADWHSNLTLLTHDSRIINNFNLENNLGWEYQQSQNWDEALIHYKKSVELYPYDLNLNNLAHAYIMKGDINRARITFYKVLHAESNQPETYDNQLAFSSWFLLQKDSPENARDFIKEALKRRPTSGYLWADLAISEYRLNNHDGAVKAAEKAKTLAPIPSINYLYELIISKQPVPQNINITWEK